MNVKETEGIRINRKSIYGIMFANDNALLAYSEIEINKMLLK